LGSNADTSQSYWYRRDGADRHWKHNVHAARRTSGRARSKFDQSHTSGFLSGIGFLGGAVIFKSGFDVKGIKAAAAIWITGELGLAIATSYWWLGITVGLVTAAVMFVADRFPDEVREEKQEMANSDLGAKK